MLPYDRLTDAFMELLGDYFAEGQPLNGERIGWCLSMAIAAHGGKAGEGREAIQDCLRDVAGEFDAAANRMDPDDE